MRKLILILLFGSFSLLNLAQFTQYQKNTDSLLIHSQDVIYYKDLNLSESDLLLSIPISINYPEYISKSDKTFNDQRQICKSAGNVRNILVSRNPEQLIITEDDQYAFIRCRLSNTIEVLKIPSGEIIKSFKIPHPSHFVLNKNETQLFVTSFTDYMIPPDPPSEDCGIIGVPGSGFSFLTIIDIKLLEIIRKDTISMGFIKKILQPANDSLLYLVGKNVVEYNLKNRIISRQWELSQQIRRTEIDNKTKQIFITTTVSSTESDSLNVIDLVSGDIKMIPYYTDGQESYASFIGLDTSSNRIFIQGRINPPEVLVYNTISLTQLGIIYNASLFEDCFLACPDLGSIFFGGDWPYNTIEVDYNTLIQKNELPSPATDHWKTVVYNKVLQRLYSFKYGGLENSIFLFPPNKLDVIEFDINTGKTFLFETTDSTYKCSYSRTLAITKDGAIILSTNSPENTVSIIELSQASTNESNINNSIQIYPNPTISKINIAFTKELGSDVMIELYNIYGALLMQVQKSKSEMSFSVDLTKYPKGHYIVRIISGNQSLAKKIIKI